MSRPRQTSNETILQAARAVFLEQGASVSTTAIAERAGVSQAVLFQRFGTKESLMMRALAPKEQIPWAGRAQRGPDEGDLRAQLRALAGEILEHFERALPAISLLRSAGYGARDIFDVYEVPPPLRGLEAITGWFERARAQGRIDGDPRAAAMAFAGALQSRIFFEHLLGDDSISSDHEPYLDWLVDFFLRGLAPEVSR